MLGETFVDVREAPRTVPLLPIPWGLLCRRAAMHRHSVFDCRREQLKIPFRLWLQNCCLEIPRRGKPGSCTGLEELLSVALVWYTYFLFYIGVYERVQEPGSGARHVFWLSHVYYLAIINCCLLSCFCGPNAC